MLAAAAQAAIIVTLPCASHCYLCYVVRRALSQAYGLCIDARGGFSGGTIASGFNQAESEEPSEVGRFMSDKYYLWPNQEK
jgi:hypothetical protein